MLAQPEIDDRVEALTEHEFEPPCDGRPTVQDCGAGAEWAGLFSCGHDRLWCTHHKEHAEYWHLEKALHCLTCKALRGGIRSPITILHIERLRGGTS